MINQHFRLTTARRLALLLNGDAIDLSHLTQLAAHALRAPVAYIALYDEPQPCYLSAIGLPDGWTSDSTAQLPAAICAQIVATGRPYTIADARRPPTASAADELELIAHAGTPLTAESGVVVGALCVADRAPRQWTDADRALLADLATAIQREIELCEREARSRTILDEQLDLVCRYLPDGRLTFVNEACCRCFGQSCSALLGANVRRWLFDQDETRFERHIAQLQQHAALEDRRVRMADGSVRWLQWTARPIRGAAQQIVEIQATGHDITERKRAEEALRASEERFRALSGSSPVGIFLTDCEGRCLYGNPRLLAITALSAEQLLGRGWTQRLHPDDAERVVREWDEYARAGREQVTEYRLQWPDGSVHWIRSRNAPLLDDVDALVGHVGTIEDITERRSMEESLRASEERFRLAVNTIPYPIVMYDAELRIQFINAPGMELCGYRHEQLLGRTNEQLFPAALTSAYLPTLHMTRDLRATQSVECSFRRSHGGKSSFLITYVPLLDDLGKLQQILGIAYDISERLQAEEQRIALERKLLETQKLESLGVLAGGIAHDFNNLLGAILGNAELALLDLPPTSAPYDCVAQIKLASQRAADLTQQMLAYSGRCRFLVQPVDLNALIREMHQLLSASIDKTATVHYQLAPELPSLMADATQLRQVVMNLLTNAAEAIGETGGAIAVRTALLHADQAYLARANLPADLPPGDYIMLSVSDTGSGMAPATIAKIFDPFFTTKFTGRGLGLAAVQGIVRGHRGALKVQSTLGSGATFTILLPTTPVAEPQPSTGQIHRRPSDRSWHGQGTVLVVDDESTVRTTAARALERFGFQVLLASNGSVGVELFRRYVATISYVLLDLTMPHMNGEQALHVMRAIDPAARIIIMSGYDEQEVLTRFSDVALDGFLHKPFLPDQLQAALQRGAQPSAA